MQIEMGTRIENVIEVGDIAVASEAWTMRLHTPDGASSEQHGQSIVLFTRGRDGWQFLVDALWGL